MNRALITLALLCALTTVVRADAPPQKRLMTTLSFTPSKNGQPLIPVQLTGKAMDALPATLVFDTGSAYSILTEEMAAKLGLAPEPASSEGGTPILLGGKRQEMVTVSRLQIGPFTNRDAKYLVLGKELLTGLAGQPVDGVIGANVLAVLPALIDFPARRITLYAPGPISPDDLKQADLGDAVVIPQDNPQGSLGFTCPVELRNGDHQANETLAVDTGSALTLISEASARRLQLPPQPQSLPLHTVFGDVTAQQVAVPAISLGGVRLSAPPPVLVPQTALPEGVPPHLGLDILSRFRILFDLPEKRMFLSPIVKAATVRYNTANTERNHRDRQGDDHGT